MVGAIHSLSAGFPCNCCGCNLLSLFSPLHSRSASIHVPMHSLCTGWNDVVPVVIQNELVVATLFLSFFFCVCVCGRGRAIRYARRGRLIQTGWLWSPGALCRGRSRRMPCLLVKPTLSPCLYHHFVQKDRVRLASVGAASPSSSTVTVFPLHCSIPTLAADSALAFACFHCTAVPVSMVLPMETQILSVA